MVAVEETTKVLYTQLICKESGRVVAQEKGPTEQVETIKRRFQVQPDQEIIVTENSEYSEPFKFLRVVLKEEVIRVYDKLFFDLEDGQLPDCEPVWVGKAIELENMPLSGHDVAGDEWGAYTEEGEWVGTSEC